MADVRISFVLCSRNDQFQGDSLWRLGTTLNYLARQLAAIGRLDEAEVIVSDWGSEEPLRDAAALTAEARKITRFLTIPAALAEEKQQDSPFGEVIAINAAARRARGEYIGRIDQDTLVGRRFLTWFFDRVENPGAENPGAGSPGAGSPRSGAPLDSTIMISNRRRIPYHFAARTPRLPLVERYVDLFGRRVLPSMAAAPPGRYWEVFIGIILFHRDLWADVEGYDESFLYYGYMEFDLFLRVLGKYSGLDIGPLVGNDFHHLDHVPAWLVGRKLARKVNPVRRPGENEPPVMRPNGPDWGLNGHDLPLEPASDSAPVLTDVGRRPGDGRELARLTAVSTARTLGQIVHDHGRQGLGELRRRLRGA